MAIDLRELEIELLRSTSIMDKWAESLQSEALDTRDRHIMTTEDQAGESVNDNLAVVEPQCGMLPARYETNLCV